MTLLGRLGLLVAFATLTAGLSFGGAVQAVGTPKPVISEPRAFDAPIAKLGGVMNPNVNCGGNFSITPRLKWTVRNVETGETTRFDWFDAYPGMRFPRLAVGTYVSHAVARCRDNRAVSSHRFTIGQKTKKSTILRAEFLAVKKGMALRRVRQIVGNGGVEPYTYGGITSRTFTR
jgi:hypothetical protein